MLTSGTVVATMSKPSERRPVSKIRIIVMRP
jgi:hypothetical protein